MGMLLAISVGIREQNNLAEGVAGGEGCGEGPGGESGELGGCLGGPWGGLTLRLSNHWQHSASPAS